jgi:phosphatidylglycerophosphatase A
MTGRERPVADRGHPPRKPERLDPVVSGAAVERAGDRVEAVVIRRPTFAFMRPRLSRWIALGFGTGLAPIGPGTAGTALAWLLYALLAPVITVPGMAVVTSAGFLVGLWAVRRAGFDLGDVDHSAIVWDEIVAFWLILLLIPQTSGPQLAAFVLFRVFDVWKPTPIREVEQRLHTPLGVMLDDLLASGYVLMMFLIWENFR